MQEFYVVHAIKQYDDFQIIGIMTHETEAEQFTESANASGRYLAVSRPQKMEMDAILDNLVRDRLRELAAPIIKLAGVA